MDQDQDQGLLVTIWFTSEFSSQQLGSTETTDPLTLTLTPPTSTQTL